MAWRTAWIRLVGALMFAILPARAGAQDRSDQRAAVAARTMWRSQAGLLDALEAKLGEAFGEVIGAKTFRAAEKNAKSNLETPRALRAIGRRFGASYIVALSRSKVRGTFLVRLIDVQRKDRPKSWRVVPGASARAQALAGRDIGERVLGLLGRRGRGAGDANPAASEREPAGAAPDDLVLDDEGPGRRQGRVLAAADLRTLDRGSTSPRGRRPGVQNRAVIVPDQSEGADRTTAPDRTAALGRDAKSDEDADTERGAIGVRGAVADRGAIAERGAVADDAAGQGGRAETLASNGAFGAAPGDEFAAAAGELMEGDGDATSVEARLSAGPLFSNGSMVIDVQGQLKTEAYRYFVNDPQYVGAGKINGRSELDLQAGATLNSRYVNAVAKLLVRRDIEDETRNRLEPEELSVTLLADVFQFQAGRGYITWGRATLNSVVDVIDPIDARDYLVREKLPVWLTRASTSIGPVRAELLVLPFFQADIVDMPRSVANNGAIISPNRWLNATFPTTFEGRPDVYRFDPGLAPGALRLAPQAALRISSAIFGADAAIAYINQNDPFPSIRSTTPPAPPGSNQNVVQTITEYHRRHVVTVDAEYALDRIHLVAEAMVAVPSTSPVQNNGGTLPYISATTGFDYRSPHLFDNQELRLFVELTATQALGGQLPSVAADPSVAITRGRFPFPLALMGRGAYSFGESVTLGLLMVQNLGQFVSASPGTPADPDFMVRPEIQLSLFHHAQIIAGVDLLGGGPRTFFGGFRQNSRFAGSLAISY